MEGDEAERRRLEEDRKAYLKNMADIATAIRENTTEVKRLQQMLQAYDIRTTGQPTARPTGSLLSPRQAGPAQEDFKTILARHFTKAFPPDHFRDMVEDFIDGFSPRRRRRKR